MRKLSNTFILICFIIIIINSACKKQASNKASPEIQLPGSAEVDVSKIESSTGLHFEILKTETHGYKPIHKFFWVCLSEKPDEQKLKDLAEAIIKEAISSNPETYHSFTIHFFCESELEETLEKSNRFAQATFLPEGSWLKVGRVPIDDYKDYKLTCEFIE